MRPLGIILIAFSLLISCEPKPDSARLLDQFVVSTNYDKQAVFSSYATYAIPTDTIWLYSNASNDTLLVQNENSSYPRPIVNAIKKNMSDRGFTLTGRNENPDLGINVSLIQDYNIYQQISYGGYGYGAGYYGYGYGYYSPYYPTYVSTVTSNQGALIIEIVDLKNRAANNTVKVLWTANISDIFNAVDINKQSLEAVDQAFKQSPFLGR